MMLTVISYAPAVLCLYAIGLLTYLKNTHSPANRWFALFTISLASWIGLDFIADLALRPEFSLWAVRTGAVFGTLTFPTLLFFCMKFPLPSKKVTPHLGFLLSIPALVFVILCLTPWLIPGIDLRNQSAQPAGVGLLYSLQSVYLIAGYLFAMAILLIKKRYLNADQKNQINLVIAGIAVGLGVNALTGFVLTVLQVSNNYSNLLGSVSFLIFAGTTAFAIIKHRLFDIRLAIVRTIGFLIAVGIVGGIYSLLILGVGAPLITDGKVALVKNQTGLLLFIPPTIFIALTFHSIQGLIARVTRQIFYQDLFDLRTVMDRFSDTLVTSNDIDKIMASSLSVITEAIKPAHAYFVVFDDSGRVYRKLAHKTSAPTSIAEMIGDIKGMKANPVIRDELQISDIPRSFITGDIFLALRLGLKDRPVGMLLFGPKQNGRTYAQQDIDLLRIGAKNLAIALDNAKKYEQISHFADKLHQEVLDATSELRNANDELKTLDALKDDFISMASHQLRTPASSVHEALQMLNHSEVPLSKADRVRLEELAGASSEQLVTVVADMLSIARIQAGHFTLSQSSIVMQDLVEKVLKQTSILAEQKHIKLVLKKPRDPLMVMVDSPKMNEAMSNYIENAIKYSPEKSTITVEVSTKDKRAMFEVSDAGIGVPVAERKNLFGKFYRAKNARTEQPDGNGIGLFVVKSIAKGHGGDTYYKPLNNGSLFGFWIPLAAPKS